MIFYDINIFMDVIQSWEAGFHQGFNQIIKQVGGGGIHIDPLFAGAVFQFLKKMSQLKNLVIVSRNQMIFGDDNIQFSWVGRSFHSIKKRDVQSKKDTVWIDSRFGPDGGSDEFLYGQRVDIKIFLKIARSAGIGVFKIYPSYIVKRNLFHF